MNILFFDTETTGIPRDYKAPVTDLNNWPRLVQLGYVCMQDEILTKSEYIICPDGFVISDEVSKIHGITQEKAMSVGVSLKRLLSIFKLWIEWADLIVGHNLSYDLNVVGAEYLRLFGENYLEGKRTCDTMLLSTDYCGIPGRYGYKWPKLNELYFKLFNKPLAQSHTALDDIQNTAKCYFELVRLGVIKA